MADVLGLLLLTPLTSLSYSRNLTLLLCIFILDILLLDLTVINVNVFLPLYHLMFIHFTMID